MFTLRQKKPGFTLIELLTVIAVIGILSAILIPTIGAARKSMNKASAKGLYTTIANALEAYRMDMGSYPPINSRFSHTAEIDGRDVTYYAFEIDESVKNGLTIIDYLTDPDENRKRRQYLELDGSNLNEDEELWDAFGNTTLGVVIAPEGTVTNAMLSTVKLPEAGATSPTYKFNSSAAPFSTRVFIWGLVDVSKSGNNKTASFVASTALSGSEATTKQ